MECYYEYRVITICLSTIAEARLRCSYYRKFLRYPLNIVLLISPICEVEMRRRNLIVVASWQRKLRILGTSRRSLVKVRQRRMTEQCSKVSFVYLHPRFPSHLLGETSRGVLFAAIPSQPNRANDFWGRLFWKLSKIPLTVWNRLRCAVNGIAKGLLRRNE